MIYPQFYEWTRAEKTQLARFVSRDIPAELKLPTSLNRADMLQRQGNIGLVHELYDMLVSKHINYDLELASTNQHVQKIRPIQVILEERRSTCLDLALLYCSICIDNDLYPLLIVAQGHAYAAFQTEGRLQDTGKTRPGFGNFVDGILTDQAACQELLQNRAYVVMECTGFAFSQEQLRNQSFPEGRGRDPRGIMGFDRAVEAGSEQVISNVHPFEYALDIYVLQEEYNLRPSDERTGPVVIEGDTIDARNSQGPIFNPTGPITQTFIFGTKVDPDEQ